MRVEYRWTSTNESGEHWPGVVLVVQDHQTVPARPSSILGLRGELAAAPEDEREPGGVGRGQVRLGLSHVETTEGVRDGQQFSRDLTTRCDVVSIRIIMDREIDYGRR